MKIINKWSLTLSLLIIVFIGCEKNQLSTAPWEFTEGKALLKINYSCPYAKNPPVIIKVNGNKVSSAITYSTPYPGGGLNTGGNSFADYLSLEPGDDTISLSIPFVGTGTDSILLHKAVYNIKANTYQTIHFTDTAANIQGIITEDSPVKPDSGYVQYRFVNLIPGPASLDLYFGATRVATNIAYKAVTDTFKLPAGISQTWSLRLAGGVVKLGSRYTSLSTVSNQRVFTVYARGFNSFADTIDIRSPKISFAFNK